MQLLWLTIGLILGAGALCFWMKIQGRHYVAGYEQLQLRVAALEETVGYLTMRLDKMEATAPERQNAPQGRPGRQPKAATTVGRGREVAQLAAQGFDALAISRELGMPRGQVDLVLRLHGGDD
jgi:hypothetical protein